MTKERKRTILILAVSTLICGAVYWPLPYNSHKWEWLQFGGWALGTMAVAAVAKIKTELTIREATFLAGFGPAIANLIRILFETTFVDPTSHNLFPFEVVIAVFVGVPSAALGSGVGHLVQKFILKKKPE
jgi:hypothetical protein